MIMAAGTALAAFPLSRLQLGRSAEQGVTTYTVVVRDRGVDAATIERQVVDPLEGVLGSVPDLVALRSIAEPGAARVWLQVANDRHGGGALAVRDAVERVVDQLPASSERPEIRVGSTDSDPVYVLVVEGSDRVPRAGLARLLEHEVRSSYSAVDGVGRVEIAGLGTEEVLVEADGVRLAATGLGLGDVASQLRSQSWAGAGGALLSARQSLPVAVAGRIASLAEMRELQLMLPAGGVMALEDVATVRLTPRANDQLSRVNGSPAIAISVFSGGDAGLIALSRELRRVTASWRGRGLPLLVLRDTGASLAASLQELAIALGAGIAAGALLIALILGRWRLATVVATVGLASAIGTAALHGALGWPLDGPAAMGIAVAMGFALDAAVVVGTRGGARTTVATAAAITAVAVVPAAFAWREMPEVMSLARGVVATLAIALVLSLTLLPALCDTDQQDVPARRRLLGHLDKWIRRAAHRVGSSPLFAVGGGLLTTAALVALLGNLASDYRRFDPDGQGNLIVGRLDLPSATSATVVDATIGAIVGFAGGVAGELRGQSHTTSRVGGATFAIDLSEARERAAISRQLREAAAQYPGTLLTLAETGDPDAVRIPLLVRGEAVTTLREQARLLAVDLEQREWVDRVVLHFKEPAPAWTFQFDHERLARADMSAAEVAAQIRWAVHGPVALKWLGSATSGGPLRELDTRVRATDGQTGHLAQISQLAITNETGAVSLEALGSMVRDDRPGRIEHTDRRRSVGMTVSLARNLGRRQGLSSEVGRVQRLLQAWPMPAGYSVEVEAEVVTRAGDGERVAFAFSFAALLVILLVAAHTGSALAPGALLALLPTTMLATLLATAAVGWQLTVTTQFGLILLLGLASTNALVLVTDARSHLERLRGMSSRPTAVEARAAVRRSLARRLPILTLTTGTTVLGQLPILIRFGEGEPVAYLALALATGAFGTLVGTVLVAPAVLVALVRLGSRLPDQAPSCT